ncbi:hypothetical protein CYMTET_26628, partial [Cymbomonas tetramitiformis]
MITRTVRQAGTDLINFLGLLVTILVIYAVMGHILFGSSMESFSRLDEAFRTCFVMMLGDTAFSEELDSNHSNASIGNIFFTTFMILVFLFLLSALLGIIVSAMDQVKEDNINVEKADLFSDLGQISMYYLKAGSAGVKHLLARLGLGHSAWQNKISEATLLRQLEHWESMTRAGINADDAAGSDKAKKKSSKPDSS